MIPPSDLPDSPGSSEPDQSRHSRRTIYSVSELTARIKTLVEASFPFIWICGEISNCRVPGSGHFYFTLKDENAQIAAVMFRGQIRQLKFTPEDGMSIIGLGRITVYELRGSYQIILEYLEPAGIGALQFAYDRLKKRLAEEGYFDKRHKKPIPYLPEKVSVITSPFGAVVHDIITTITRRYSTVHIEIVPARVQGPGAEDEIVAALNLVNACANSDVIILARGGGSLEDLQAFNSEAVAMAIFHSTIPVISAVGHETDVTISDFIADLRAPTPSAAAELAVPEKKQLIQRCQELRQALCAGFMDYFRTIRTGLNGLTCRMLDPRRRIQEWWLRIDDFSGRLARLSSVYLDRSRERLTWWLQRFNASSPRGQIQKYKIKLDQIDHNLLLLINIISKKNESLLRENLSKLQALSPLAILQRGYSVARTLPDRRVIMGPGQVNLDQELEVLLAAGMLLCRIKGKSTYGEENL